MTAIAVIIGIDDYPWRPLTSAVNDALAIREALLELSVAAEHEVVLLTSPLTSAGGQLATRQKINATLSEVYDKGSRVDRLYFFYAGHGLTAFVDGARTVTHTALIPPDVEDLSLDSNLLLNFDDFLHRMERAGPREQFYFVDACRDLQFEERPYNLPTLGWPAAAEPSSGPTAQAALFAVSPGGTALGVKDGMGVMTQHLIDALHNKGLALDWSDELDKYVVTAESVARHVGARGLERLQDAHQWREQVMLPELRRTGGTLSQLRVVDDPPRPSLTLRFDPADAATDTSVELTMRGIPLPQPTWPPCRAGEPVTLSPQVYRVHIRSERGPAYSDPAKLDLRQITAASIRLGESPTVVASSPSPGPATVQSAGRLRFRGSPATTGSIGATVATVRADALEPGATIELVGEDPPYRRWEGAERLTAVAVPAGPYRIRFRLGRETYSREEFDLLAGESKYVRPGGLRSALLTEAGAQRPDGSVALSDVVDRMLASSLLTLLSLVAILPFDRRCELAARLRQNFPSPQTEPVGHDVSVIVGVDGTEWPLPAHEVARGFSCELVGATGMRQSVGLDLLQAGTGGWARVVRGSAPAPSHSFNVRIQSPTFGVVNLAAATLPGRVTVVAVVPTPDGAVDTMLHILQAPGSAANGAAAPGEYERRMRELVRAQRLYAAGELLRDASAGADTPASASATASLPRYLRAAGGDPILLCMAYHAWRAASADVGAENRHSAASNAQAAATHLIAHFGELPDTKVIKALAADQDPQEYLSPGELPVLGQTLQLVRQMRRASGAADLASRIAPDSALTLIRGPINGMSGRTRPEETATRPGEGHGPA